MREKKHKRFRLIALLGPGMLTALAGNDAGGIISYTVTGAKFGSAVFVPLTLGLILITYTVQEMAMRLGVVADKGYTGLVRELYGRGWMVYQVISLFIENLITLLTEFIGMSAGLSIIGIPLWLSVILSTALVLSIAVLSGYRAKERLGLIIGLLNVVFIFLALFTKPNLSVAESFVLAHGHDFRWYVVALIGNAIAPWMIFYQNSAYGDKGVEAQDINNGRLDTIIGCVCQVIVASALIVIGSSLFQCVPNLEQSGPAQLIPMLSSRFGSAVGLLFALGLFNSGLLAAITVSLASSWSVAEAFGWAKSLNDKIRDAPGFYAIYFFSVCIAAAAVLIPNLPFNQIAVLAQVAGGALMAPILLFLTLITSNPAVMGAYANTKSQKIRAWVSVSLLIIICIFTIFSIAV